MYRPSSFIKVSELYDEYMLLDTRTGKYLNFNETGNLFWKVLVKEKNEEEMIQHLLEQIDADRTQIERSLSNFTEELLEQGIIEK
ncbi:PqqD family protein [Bacillus sp. CGMCC 1.60114]|uniref:PqqD family protein n=1 Tax=unclassified Bacillus (in: firmicutes) TaxID=185979 RepID=UPI001572B8C6|nr:MULTISPECIES: PqqD family protein [unclassified Bacillus (in: firmicutes)]MBC6975173.1 PqqD family protein [Bacillus sp. Xin]NSW39217.1 PqqD family protein [Bacillus sp. Xin1]